MPTIALFAGAAALLAGLVKYGMDAYRASRNPRGISLTIGDQSIELPSTYTPAQVAAIVAVMQDKATADQPSK
jgi:hypothetical protein